VANPTDRGFGTSESHTGTHRFGTQSGPQTGTHCEEHGTGVLETAKDKAQEWASNVATSAEQAWETTKSGAQQMVSSVSSTAESAMNNVTTFIRRNPIASIACSVAFGFVLAEALSLFSSSRKYYYRDMSNRT
jgi:ElaB/YqjD/DUF883 family membrane-anchored ribosome-binding protein